MVIWEDLMLRLIEKAAIWLTLSLSSVAAAVESPVSLESQITRLEQKTGIELHLVQDEPRNTTQKSKSYIGPVEHEHALKMLPTLERVLLQYPEPIRGDMLQRIHLIGRLKMRGKPFLGLARPKKFQIDMAIRAKTKPRAFASTLHHEISHLIEGDPRFPIKAWLSISEGDYSGNLTDAPKQAAGHYHALGFVTRYASRNRHEDFAEMVELGFSRPKKLLRLAAKHERIRDKVVMMTAVYQRVAPELDAPWVDERVQRAVRRRAPTRIAQGDRIHKPTTASRVHKGHAHVH
jgi:hypothetical protein